MARTKTPKLNATQEAEVLATLTHDRLRKYLVACRNETQRALRLYVLNAKLSAAFFVDMHYVEVAMRNKFDHLLISRYGPDWFKNPAFVGLFVKKHFYVRDLLAGAQSKAAKGHPPGTVPPRGKVIAELTFGFWTGLTASRFEHTLWTPLLRQTFRGTPPSRANFSTMVDQLRILRNRLAHHEPIFHRNLSQDYHDLCTVAGQLCPLTAMVMGSTSSVKRELMAIPGRRKRRR